MKPISEPTHYNANTYNIPRALSEKLHKLEPYKSLWALVTVWIGIVALIGVMRFLIPTELFWWFYVPVIILIAGRQGALLQLIHEGSHKLLAHKSGRNDLIAKWFCALPLGLSYEGYVRGHVLHHAYTNTDRDPKSDTEKYRVCDVRKPELYKLLMKDLLGITALGVFFAYKKDGDQTVERKSNAWAPLVNLCYVSLVQLVILGALFQFNILAYVLLWLIPAISPHMFLMRVRGIAEHGLANQLGVVTTRTDQGAFYTRSFTTSQNHYKFTPFIWLERILIGSFSVYYHHEHHLMLRVPFYNLKALHDHVKDRVATRNPEVYARGYFAAALRSVLKSP